MARLDGMGWMCPTCVRSWLKLEIKYIQHTPSNRAHVSKPHDQVKPSETKKRGYKEEKGNGRRKKEKSHFAIDIVIAIAIAKKGAKCIHPTPLPKPPPNRRKNPPSPS